MDPSSPHPGSRRKLFLPLFIAFIMVSSIFGVIVYNSGDTSASSLVTLNGFRFRTQQGRWITDFNGGQLSLQHNPQTLSAAAPLPFSLAPFSSAQKIYLTKHPGEDVRIPEAEFYVNLKPFFPALSLACTSDGEGCADLPLRSCADATPDTLIVFLTLGEPRTTLENSCYTLSGDAFSLTQTIDTIILTLIGALP